MPAPHENPTAEPWPVPYEGLLDEHLPNDFDPNSDEHFRRLSEEDLTATTDELHRVISDVTGTTSDLPYVLMRYPEGVDISERAKPQDVAVARNIIREVIRRAAENPEWGLTQEYLFGGDR